MICLQGEKNSKKVKEFFKTNKMRYSPIIIEKKNEIAKVFLGKRSDVCAMNPIDFEWIRTKAGKPNNYIILPEIIQLED